jgi:hypothetical protein
MTEIQRHAIAAGFLHVLHVHNDLFERWMRIPKDDYTAIGELLKNEMGLAQAPDKDDLQAMAAYIDAHLKSDVAAIQEAHENAPKHVGFMTVTQQS